ETVSTNDPCQLIEDKGDELLGAHGDPCGNVSGNGGTGNDDLKRFSKERVAEYDNKKMKCSYGSNGKNEGACAPFRRLHVCDKNLEQIKPHTITATHNLLLDVCLAAKYEGESLKGYHEQYEVQYPSSGSTMCTELARSFADIGDIVRGKDLYSGNKKENKQREKLDKKLKDIFGKIHGNLKDARTHYSDTTNYYQLREDWWTANRSTVWEAITCGAPDYAQYFRGTCGNTKIPSKTPNKCRCPKTSDGKAIKAGGNVSIVPTYFDYVPQFLRWVRGMGRRFCRKKKKKVENLQNNVVEKIK
ncbi:PfEMP1, partial [Plasmodium falciparum Dd2]